MMAYIEPLRASKMKNSNYNKIDNNSDEIQGDANAVPSQTYSQTHTHTHSHTHKKHRRTRTPSDESRLKRQRTTR